MYNFSIQALAAIISATNRRMVNDAKSITAQKPVLGSSVYSTARAIMATEAESTSNAYTAVALNMQNSSSRASMAVTQLSTISSALSDISTTANTLYTNWSSLSASERSAYVDTINSALQEVEALADQKTSGGDKILYDSSVTIYPSPELSNTYSIPAVTRTQLDLLIAEEPISPASAADVDTFIDTYLTPAVNEMSGEYVQYSAVYSTLDTFASLNTTMAANYADMQANYEYFDSTALAASITKDQAAITQGTALMASIMNMYETQAQIVMQLLGYST